MENETHFGGSRSSDPEVIRFLQQLLKCDVKPTQMQNLVHCIDPKKETKVEASLEPENVAINDEASKDKFSYLNKRSTIRESDNGNGINYAKASIVEPFWEAQRTEMIGLQPEQIVVEPTPQKGQNGLPIMKMSADVADWESASIYSNLPEAARPELDRILKVGHLQKVEVIQALNAENPVSYEYNPKKSRTRIHEPTSYRSKNNLASRRSRQRKKFVTQVGQHAVDYEVDENFIFIRQMNWIIGVIRRFEGQNLANGRTAEEILNLRSQCGLE